MSLWNFEEKPTEKATGSFESGGGSFEPIPSGTQLKAIIDEAKYDSYEGESYISLRWVVIDGEFANRNIFQKLKVFSEDGKKRDKALNMLLAIDANAGGGLSKLKEPTDMDLMKNLISKPMAIKVEVWEMNDKSGNWVSAVAPTGAETKSPAYLDDNDDVPF
jgi:hypothetical protein